MKIISLILSLLLGLFLTHVVTFAQNPSGQKEKPKIGLVLSGGGAKGLAHIGFLKVMEEVGIYPDYIAGTSMGSIVGALYAIGYSADSLEKIATNANWNFLLGDQISRRNLTLEEKEDEDRFFVSFPIKENRILIPSGVINGHNIENLLNALCAPVYETRDFSEFRIPFMCVATDIETGEEVLFNSGYLPKILRASMSIPSIFNPVLLDNKLLVDGGVVNNFPVARLKEMGADIIIGVDVGFQYYSKDELTSMVRIIEQAVFFYGEELNEYNKSLADILIEPDLAGYNATSFNSADTIIAIGEREARKFVPALRKLADSLDIIRYERILTHQTPEMDSLLLTEIRVKGLNQVSAKLFTGKLQLEILSRVSPQQINEAMERLYSSLYFEKVSYEIEPLDHGVRLIVTVEESRGGQFRVGLHYDTYFRSSMLLNTTFRNLLLDGSKLSASIGLGENPFFQASFFKNNGWRPGYGINFVRSRFDVFTYEGGRRTSSLNYIETRFQLFTQSIFRNSYAMGAGVEYESVRLRPRINPIEGFEGSTDNYLNYYGFIKMDSYDNASYPTRGLKLDIMTKLITNAESEPSVFLSARFSKAYNLGDRITLISHINGGAADGDSIPYQYNFYTGGLNPLQRNGLIPFVGLDFMERSSSKALILGLDLQLRFFENLYVLGRTNIGNMKNSLPDLLTYDDLVGGYGITVGYDSFIGPIEFTLMKSTRRSGLMSFLNIGYWF